MTRDEILNEPAGPRMDAWVAEHVMGRVVGTHPTAMAERASQKLLHASYDYLWMMPNKRLSAKIKFSTDIAAAWEVVKQVHNMIAGNGDYFTLALCTNEADTLCVINETEDWRIEAHADTAPLAICRAALLTTLEE